MTGFLMESHIRIFNLKLVHFGMLNVFFFFFASVTVAFIVGAVQLFAF